MKTFLHVGCGNNTKEAAGAGFQNDNWKEIRFDINPDVKPDILGTMTDMSAVADNSIDAIFSSHNIEHLYPHEVPLALAEFKRILNDDGFALITCPDLQSVARLVAEDKLTDPAYHSPAGPITPLDMLYGLRSSMANGNLFMAHRCGFTKQVLGETIHQCGFNQVIVRQYEQSFALWALALVSPLNDAELKATAQRYFPRKRR